MLDLPDQYQHTLPLNRAFRLLTIALAYVFSCWRVVRGHLMAADSAIFFSLDKLPGFKRDFSVTDISYVHVN